MRVNGTGTRTRLSISSFASDSMTIFYVVSVDGQINWLGNRIDFPKYRCLLNENESRQTNQYQNQKQEQKQESGLHFCCHD